MIFTDSTSRFRWGRSIRADKSEVTASDLIELREAADFLDQEVDNHIKKGGEERHPGATR